MTTMFKQPNYPDPVLVIMLALVLGICFALRGCL